MTLNSQRGLQLLRGQNHILRGRIELMSSQYSLADVLERMYENQLALEAALMDLTLHVEAHGHADVGNNVRCALEAIGENAGHIKQGLARLSKLP